MSTEYRLYLGSYTGLEFPGEGIGLATVDSSGRVSVGQDVVPSCDPSFLAMAPGGTALYAVNELSDGHVVALRVLADGRLREINSQPTHGSAPCHLSVHPNGKFLLTANYLSGSLVVHAIDDDGALREPCHVVQHSGRGPDEQRQLGPHAHQVLPSPDGRFVLVVDLGTDAVYVYDFDDNNGHLSLRKEVPMTPASGPRHLAFHPSGDRAFLINELANTVTELGYDAEGGGLVAGTTLSTLPGDNDIPSLAAEVVVTPDGRFVLGSNRGHDSVAVFAADGDFRLLDICPAGVAEPRHIAVTPDGQTLIAAGQRSSTVQSFRIGARGELTPVGEPVPAPCPVCVLPVPV